MTNEEIRQAQQAAVFRVLVQHLRDHYLGERAHVLICDEVPRKDSEVPQEAILDVAVYLERTAQEWVGEEELDGL